MSTEEASTDAPRDAGRRAFLRGAGTVAAVGAVGAFVGSCDTVMPTEERAPVPGPAVQPPDAHPGDVPVGVLRFLNEQQAEVLDAMLARLIPGDEDDPGAREAGVIFYIDNLLASHEGFAEKTYTRGPFAEGYEGDEPPAEDDENTIHVPEDLLPRYGWQSRFLPRDIYEMGLARLNRLAQDRHDGTGFADLTDEEQDELLEAVEDGEDEDVEELFDELDAGDFFSVVRHHTIEGFLADPAYGGNHDMVGWRLIGFPGAQRQYTPVELITEQEPRPPKSLAQLHPFHPHRDEDHAHADEIQFTVRTPHPNGPID